MSSENIVQAEIDNYIKEKSALFDKLKVSSEPLIETTMDFKYVKPLNVASAATLTTNQSEQQKFLKTFQDQYNLITKLRAQYFKESDAVNAELASQSVDIMELETQKRELETKSTTEFRKLKEEKRSRAKQEYYYHLYMICGIVQLIVIIALYFVYNKTIPLATGLTVFAVGMVGLGIFIVYYVFLKENERDSVVFDRYKFDKTRDMAGIQSCPDTQSNKRKRVQDRDLDTKLAKVLTDTKGQCPAYQSDEPVLKLP